MPMRRNLVQCSVVSTYDTAIAYTKNEDFNSGGTGGFTANTGTVSNPTGNQLHMTANWASKPLATTSVYLVNGRSYTLNLDIVGFSVVSGFSHTVRVRVVLPGAAFNTDFTTTGTKTITFTSNTTGYVNIEIRSIISPPTGVYSGNPYIDIDNFKVSWDSAFTSSDTICVSKSGYRYGFNGMEKVDEISGEGNGYDFGARMYDGRLGMFLTIDPKFKEYCIQSPYCGFNLNPNYFVDPTGMGGDYYGFYSIINGKKTFIVTDYVDNGRGQPNRLFILDPNANSNTANRKVYNGQYYEQNMIPESWYSESDKMPWSGNDLGDSQFDIDRQNWLYFSGEYTDKGFFSRWGEDASDFEDLELLVQLLIPSPSGSKPNSSSGVKPKSKTFKDIQEEVVIQKKKIEENKRKKQLEEAAKKKAKDRKPDAKGHRKKGDIQKHQKGDRTRKKDQGGEKKDKNKKY